MVDNMQNIYLAIPLACLAGGLIAGLFGRVIGRTGAHTAAILGVFSAFVLSLVVYKDVIYGGNSFNGAVYVWGTSGQIPMEIGFQIDALSALMMVVVSFVSLMVHIYTVGYMRDDPGYQRFFSYIALFYFLHADVGDVQQFPAAVFRLGGGGPDVLSAHRLLVHPANGHRGQS